MSKRAAIIITDAWYVDGVTLRRGDGSWNDEAEQLWLETSEQLLADLRTLARFPDLLRLADDPPSILQTPVTVDNTDLLAAFWAQDRVRALLPEEDEDGDAA